MITERDVKRASRLILRLQVRFPNSFNNFKNNDPMLGLMAEEWAMDLQSLSDEDMLRGLDKVRTSGATFCPSLPEYIAMCKPEKRVGAHALDALPPPVKVVSDEQAEKNIGILQAMMSGVGRV
ncbi:MAG: hypothetical protein HOL70_10070 [Candidatus Marinimicrobia bacterium]|mgnify:FL=1|jgi:hypothetical protein|nr:hypothetical protein [Candidatus Neomarinimicrobiota bacterium]